MSNPNVKYCKYCGFESSDGSIFCENCGKKLSDAPSHNVTSMDTEIKRCKTCGAIFQKGAKTCPNCGVNTFQPIAAQLKKCKYCHCDIAANAIQCPHCGKQNPYFILIVAALVIVFIFMFSFNSILSNNNNLDSNSVDISASNQATHIPTEAHSSQNTVPATTDKTIYEDDVFSVAYMKLLDAPDGITATYLQLKIENKSSNTLTLGLDEVYVNDISVYSGTAMPITLTPGKISQTPFILFTGNTVLASTDITKLEFKISGRDENFKILHTTNTITVGK